MTKIIKSLSVLRREIKNNNSNTLNFVPTMGNLHQGHLSLIEKAKIQKCFIIVSIFINPLQFSEKKDFINYPRTLKEDIEKLNKLAVNVIFIPKKSFGFHNSSLILNNFSKKLCAIDRFNHFEGVAYIILKFLLLIRPNYIFLGKKDYQQTLVIRGIIEEFHLETKIKLVPTVRNKDGVALSSRNALISPRKEHLILEIYKTLQFISSKLKNSGIGKSSITSSKRKLISLGFDKVNYLEILNYSNLEAVSNEPCKAMVFISVTLEGVRLIDNVDLEGKVKKKDNLIVSS